jgi:hypothetical protein
MRSLTIARVPPLVKKLAPHLCRMFRLAVTLVEKSFFLLDSFFHSLYIQSMQRSWLQKQQTETRENRKTMAAKKKAKKKKKH